MRRICTLSLLFIVVAEQLLAQPREPRQDAPPQFLFYEAISLPSTDSTKSRVDIHYRIGREFFIAVRNDEASIPWKFVRRGDISIELIDSSGVSKARDIDRIVIGEQSTETDPESRQWYQGVVSLSVPPGLYTILFQLDDSESKRNFLDQSRTIRAPGFQKGSQDISTLFFVTAPEQAAPLQDLLPENCGGDLLFGSAGSLYLGLTSPDTPVQVNYTFRVASPSSEDSTVVQSGNITDALLLRGLTLVPKSANGTFLYEVTRTDTARGQAILIRLPTEKLPLRSYRLILTVKQGTSSRTITRNIRMVWPDMPFSLRDIDYALDALRYITRPGQLDSLKQGNYETRRDALEKFWRSKNENPATEYNEVMTQYYRRVDSARRSFGTLSQSDGAKTDRGRILILHGPPTRTDRTLDPKAGYQEVWYYERLNKKFTFVDQRRSGEYILVSTTPL